MSGRVPLSRGPGASVGDRVVVRMARMGGITGRVVGRAPGGLVVRLGAQFLAAEVVVGEASVTLLERDES